MRLVNLLKIFIVALKFEAEGEPTTGNNVTVGNVTSTESCNESTAEEKPEANDIETTLTKSEPLEAPEDLVDKEQSFNNNSSTEVPGTESILIESEKSEGSANLVGKEESFNNNPTEVAENQTTANSETQEGLEKIFDEKQSLKNNSSTDTLSTESTSTESTPEEGIKNLIEKRQFH